MQLHNIPIFLDYKRCFHGLVKDEWSLCIYFLYYFCLSLLSSVLIRYFYPLHSDLPAGSQECSGKLHQEALHQVYLPHGILPDLPLPPAAGLTAHRPHQPAHAGTPAHYRGVDDSPMGAWYVQTKMTFYTDCCCDLLVKIVLIFFF